MTELIIAALIFALGGLLFWVLYLIGQVEQRDGALKATQDEVDWIKRNCPTAWAEISVKLMARHFNEDR